MIKFSFYLLLLALAGSAVLLPLGATLLVAAGDLPDPAVLRTTKLQIPLRIYSREGSLINEYGVVRRAPVRLEDLPPLLIQAVIAAEDARFYAHRGVDPRSVARAVLHNLQAGRIVEGAGTITMQVARNYLLTRDRTYTRKVREAILALRIERQFDKKEILEMYLNKIYFGHRAYGVAAAARIYFGRPPEQLGLAEIALLTGLPQNPAANSPFRDPRNARRRRAYVLGRMLELGYIDRESYAEALQAPLQRIPYRPTIGLHAPYLAEWTRRELQKRYGDEIYSAGYRVYTTVSDPLQAAARQALRRGLLEYSLRHGDPVPERHYELPRGAGPAEWRAVLAEHLESGGLYPALVTEVRGQQAALYLRGIGRFYLEDDAPRGTRLRRGDLVRVMETAGGDWKLARLPAVEGSLAAVDPRTGAALAMVGGFDFRRSTFNRATQARRQPGSGFKPFIYSAALEAGFNPASRINDVPLVFPEHKQHGEPWRPQNYDRTFRGPITLRKALTQSRNIVSVRLVEEMGMPFTKAYLSRFGFRPEQLPETPTMALGNVDVSLWELLRGYSVFANGGFLVEPYFIDRVEDRNGNVVWRHVPRPACPECPPRAGDAAGRGVGLPVALEPDPAAAPEATARRVISPENAWLISSMTRDVIRHGTGRRARALGRRDLSGKTGTTNNLRDAWFVGFNAELAAAAWVGFDDYRSLGRRETGARAALPIWMYFMENALRGQPEAILQRPLGVQRVHTGIGDDFEFFRPEDQWRVPDEQPRKTPGESARNPRDSVF